MLRTKLISCAVAIAAAVSAVAPASALPLTVPTVAADAAGDVTNIQYQSSNRSADVDRRGYWVDGNNGYYNGHRGYRYARPGWRSHNGWWFPPAAFALGVIVGQGVQPGYRQLPNRHYRWCENTYNSYRRSDNTFRHNYGGRRTCRSPYWG